MKIHFISIGIVTTLLCSGFGCSQSESGTSNTDGSNSEEVVVEEVSVQETVTEVADTAKQALSDANEKAQELLTQAKNLVSEKKYEEAGNILQSLSNMELTPEQQKLVDDLKATIQKALQSDAVKEGTKALGNMLGGEKK